MSTEKLITYYEKRLDKVIKEWKDHGQRGQEYIDNAKEQLEEVKNGRTW